MTLNLSTSAAILWKLLLESLMILAIDLLVSTN